MAAEEPRRAGDDQRPRDTGEVSEVSSFDDEPRTPHAPEDATAGYPDSESGAADEGTAGPDAPPRHGRPERSNESSR